MVHWLHRPTYFPTLFSLLNQLLSKAAFKTLVFRGTIYPTKSNLYHKFQFEIYVISLCSIRKYIVL